MEEDKFGVSMDSIQYLTLKTDFPVRHAIEFTGYEKNINITDNLYSFPGFIYRHDKTKRRVSYLTYPNYPKYAVYKTSYRLIALATGIAIGYIIGAIISAKVITFTAGLATPLVTKIIIAGTSITATGIANYLSNQIPIKVFSEDPNKHNFNKEFLKNNLQIPYEIIKGNDYDFIDNKSDDSFRKSLIEVRDSAKGFLVDTKDGIKNTFGLGGSIIKYSPYLALGYGVYYLNKKGK
ncbi:MAG: hypothetical protein KDK36_06240 [Leptospiraceae bacterium]|nr:hypothetical protein [Leptospiraceae bacterium]